MSQHDTRQQHYDDGLEVVPSSFPEVVQPPLFSVTEDDVPPGTSHPAPVDAKPALVAKDAEGLIAQDTETPPPPQNAEEPSSTQRGWATRKKVVVIAALLLLLAIAIGLGAGLGLGLRGAATTTTSNQAASATTTAVVTQVLSSSPTPSSSGSSGSSSGSTPQFTGSVISPASPTSTTTAAAQDPDLNDQLVTKHVASWFYTGQTADQVNQLCARNNARITQVRVDNGTVPTFTVLMIENTGVYHSDWWWYYGANSTSQGTDRRLISIDPYYDAQSTVQFAVVQVPETGSQNKAWWWYFGISSGSIDGLLQKFNARLVSLRGYIYNGAPVYTIIMAQNTDDDFIQSVWYTGMSIDDIKTKLNTGQRLISLSPNPKGGWDTIMVAASGDKWGWWFDLDYQAISSTTTENDLRMVDVSVYTRDGSTLFAAVETDNNG